MEIITDADLLAAIVKYRENHPRSIIANFEGKPKEYPCEQPGLDIIEALCERIMQLEVKVQNLTNTQHLS